MTTWTITAPNAKYTGISANVKFKEGKGVTDDPSVLDWFRRHGYAVKAGGDMLQEPHPSVSPSTFGQAPRSRDAAVLGADAAGPVSDAFLPPIGAGEGKDPHGPEVVAPGLHAVPPAPVAPGVVSSVPAEQEVKESELAEAVLVDNEPVPEATVADVDVADNGPIGLSDPASVGEGPDAAALERPKKSAAKKEWVAYATAHGVTQDEAESLSRDALVERFPEQGGAE